MSSLGYVMPKTTSNYCQGRKIDYTSLFKFNHQLVNLATNPLIASVHFSVNKYLDFNIKYL